MNKKNTNYKVLVIGSSGFIGSNLCKRLITSGHEVYGCDIVRPKKSIQYNHMYCDITKYQDVKRIMSTLSPDYIYYLSALMRMSDFHPNVKPGWDVNVTGLVNVLECCKDITNLRRVVFSSTVHVYSACDENVVDEQTLLHNQISLHPYALSKLTCENIIRSYHKMSGIPHTILRFGVVIGPGGHRDQVVHRFVELCNSMKTITIQGTGNISRCFVYIDDLVDCACRVLYSNVDGVFNCCLPDTITIRELLDFINVEGTTVTYEPERAGDFSCPVACNNKAENLLGWKPVNNIFDSILKYKNWYNSIST